MSWQKELTDLAAVIHQDNRAKGFYDDAEKNEHGVFMLARLGLIHSEVSEATEFVRKPAPDDHLPERPGLHCELADILIRTLDLAAYVGCDIGEVVEAKLAFNRTRPFKHAKSC